MKFFKKELHDLYECCQLTLKELESDNDYREKYINLDISNVRDMFNISIGCLNDANRKFIWAITFSIIAILIGLLKGFEYAFTSAMLLFGAPHLITSTFIKHKQFSSYYDILKLHPISLIEKKTEYRDIYALSVWSIALFSVLALGIYYWGSGDGMNGPF